MTGGGGFDFIRSPEFIFRDLTSTPSSSPTPTTSDLYHEPHTSVNESQGGETPPVAVGGGGGGSLSHPI